MYTYQTINEYLGNREERVIKRSKLQTRAIRRETHQDSGGVIAIQLVETDIMTFHSDGRIVLNSGGWRTVTTKARINEYLPTGWQLYQERGVWYLHHGPWKDGETWVFADGMTIHPDESVTGEGEDPRALERLGRKVSKYAQAFVDALFEGEVPAPSSGDCWYCALREKESGKPLGELTSGADHILSHIEEGYHVPSLLVRAIEVYPVSRVARWVLQEIWHGEPEEDFWAQGIVAEQLRSSLRRYVKRQVGLA